MSQSESTFLPSSFRDPSGRMFENDGTLFRTVSKEFAPEYELAKTSGLYDALTRDGLLIPHIEIADDGYGVGAHAIVKPERIPFISYPHEWCFGQLKDAALLTLRLEEVALAHDMTLKDGSAYNVQFRAGKPVHIDTLSFERYIEGAPWVAYRQFCQHFLAPLALIAHTDPRLGQLSRIHIDGIPLDLASALLPRRTYFSPLILSHLHLHSRAQRSYAARTSAPAWRMPKRNRLALIESLRMIVEKLSVKDSKTEWRDYYSDTNYSDEAFADKKRQIAEIVERVRPAIVWDLGANDGEFGRIASGRGIPTVAFDVDYMAVEKNYDAVKRTGETHMLPLVADLTNPTAGFGWASNERMSLVERGPAAMTWALALVHHLVLSHNIPLESIARFLSTISERAVVEFVPQGDSQVRRLLSTRVRARHPYSREAFEAAFARHFTLESSSRIADSERLLYCFTRNNS